MFRGQAYAAGNWPEASAGSTAACNSWQYASNAKTRCSASITAPAALCATAKSTESTESNWQAQAASTALSHTGAVMDGRAPTAVNPRCKWRRSRFGENTEQELLNSFGSKPPRSTVLALAPRALFC